MKRSRTTALLLMSAAPLLFTACQKDEAVQVQEGLYTSVQACSDATGDPSSCRAAFAEAQKQSADAAPKYASREACEAEYNAEQCVEQKTSTGHSFIGPMMMGFFMSQMLSNRGAGLAQQPSAAPAYQDKAKGWARPAPGGSGGLNTASGIGAGKAGLAPVNATPNRAVTASRGGFGGTSSNRSSVGG
ncbi:DUF1190 domain-containing protein [Stenotrophomonas sp. GZD-301]|jgi:uncharacterized protein YgiB involved in biofilm formation|uniref:DUF1190 domain-containing protein n=1 Tax=Stenotrophomonas sp. GZD-301 TaxID=3404814 RepID=UPI003BB713C9